MLAIRHKNKRKYIDIGGRGNFAFTPALFRNEAHAYNHMRRLGLSPDSWETIEVLVFEVNEEREPIGPLSVQPVVELS